MLPAGWRADGGIPVQLRNGSVLTMFGDTITQTQSGDVLAGSFVHNTVVIDSEVITNAIRNSVSGSYFWPMDALELADGALLVLASEVVADPSSWFGFRSIDTDGFVVADPRSEWAWRTATKVEDGPWADSNVIFLDGQPHLAAVREPGSSMTTIVEFGDVFGDWLSHGVTFDGSDGVFAPVQTAGGWFGVSWHMDESATLWRSATALGPWLEVETIDQPGAATYGHGLSVIDGRVWWRWSNGEGSQRVEYRPFDALTMEG